jgi:hypothetical protein
VSITFSKTKKPQDADEGCASIADRRRHAVQAVKTRQAEASTRAFPKAASRHDSDAPAARTGFWSNQRPKHLLTGLMRKQIHTRG